MPLKRPRTGPFYTPSQRRARRVFMRPFDPGDFVRWRTPPNNVHCKVIGYADHSDDMVSLRWPDGRVSLSFTASLEKVPATS